MRPLAILISKSCANDADEKSNSAEIRAICVMRVFEMKYPAARKRCLSILNPLLLESPNTHAVFRREIERIFGSHIERLVPFVEVSDYAVDAEL